jgi:hypothetical protein
VTPFSRFVTAVAIAGLPFLARGEGKCYDDPYHWKEKNMLVVTWVVPMPGDAKADTSDGSLLADLDARFGAEPPGFLPEYASNVARYSYPAHPSSKKTLKNRSALESWLAGFKFPLEPEAAAALDKYFKEGRSLYGLVVQHPPVSDNGVGFRFCTCTLQRAVIVWDGDQEQMWVRSTFRSARDQRTFANFVPENPVKFTFAATRIWFPLALNRILPEPGAPAFVLLDVLTKKPLDRGQIPAGFVDQAGTVQWNGATWQVTRMWRKYQRSDAAEDLSMVPPR